MDDFHVYRYYKTKCFLVCLELPSPHAAKFMEKTCLSKYIINKHLSSQMNRSRKLTHLTYPYVPRKL